MKFLCELVEINHNIEMINLLEDLGNLGKLGLGSMVDAFKQTYNVYGRDRYKDTSPIDKKFTMTTLGKDSETVDAGNIKNWAGLKRAYKSHSADYPLATIFEVDNKPVALMIGSGEDLDSINNKVALAWDFSKLDLSKEEIDNLTKGLNSNPDFSAKLISSKNAASEKITAKNQFEYNRKKGEYDEKTIIMKYSGFVQTVREIVPFINNLASTFSNTASWSFPNRLTVKLILADKVRIAKHRERIQNPPIDPKDIKIFKDDLKTRLAKYKNTKIDSVETAEDFIKKVFSGSLKKLRFAGHSFSAIPDAEYMGSSGKDKYFYNGTMKQLFLGNPVTMKFSADDKEGDYSSLYLTVKLENGVLKPVEIKYAKAGDPSFSYETIKF